MKKSLIIFSLLIVFSAVNAQTKTNLEKYYQLIENSVKKTSDLIKSGSTISLSVSGPSSLEVLKPKVFESFSKNDFIIKNENSDNIFKVSYLLAEASVEYGEAEKDGFFGNLICERKVSLKGIITLTSTDGNVKSNEVNEAERDTIVVDEIRDFEDAALQLTHGAKPEVSFFSNLLEPVLVVATLVTTVILLFSVRGK